MRLLSVIICYAVLQPAIVLGTTPAAIPQHRQRIEEVFEAEADQEFDFFRRSTTGSHAFLTHQRFDLASHPHLAKLTQQFAARLMQLARSALEAGDGALAYDLLHEAAFFDHSVAKQVVAPATTGPEVRLWPQRHKTLRWKGGSYFRIFTQHFQIVTRDKSAGIETANRMETLHAVWRQLFFDCWSNAQDLATALEHGKPLLPKTRRLHRVVLFSDRAEYLSFLQAKHTRIAVSLGYYDVDSRTSFLCIEDASASTQLHEVTHQLFQELSATGQTPSWQQNSWALEGVAMYMESLYQRGPIATVGGFHAYRLQFARYRRLQEQFYVPLADLAILGRDQLQRHAQIRRLYSQSAGLTHFFMDGNRGQYRDLFIAFLNDVYSRRDSPDRLATLLSRSYLELDAQYAQFLRVEDDEVLGWVIHSDSLLALCLGDTHITDRALHHLGRQSQLDWLDLARTRVQDDGMRFLESTRSLRQVNLDGTQITDKTISRLVHNGNLEELDLSDTRITDDGIAQLSQLAALRVLWLSNTAITDAAVPALTQLAALEQLALDGTQLTQSGRQTLLQRFPELVIH